MSVFLTLTNRAVSMHHKDSKDGDLTTLVRVAFHRHSLICILVLKPEFPEKLKGIRQVTTKTLWYLALHHGTVKMVRKYWAIGTLQKLDISP